MELEVGGGSMSSIDLVEVEGQGGRHDSANSWDFESTRRPGSYYITSSNSESESGGISITVKRKTMDTMDNTDDIELDLIPVPEPLSKRRRLAEAAGLEEVLENSMEESFMNGLGLRKRKTTVKRSTWHYIF